LGYLDQPSDQGIRDVVEIAHHRHANQIDDASQVTVLIVMENRHLNVFGPQLARVLTNLFGWEFFE
jgi:hypothetical protein